MALEQQKVTFIGAGNMAKAIIGGLIEKGFPAANITASAPAPEHLDALKTSWSVNTTDNNRLAAESADIIVLSVKPQVLKDVCLDLLPALAHQPLIISIAAGVELESLQTWLGEDQAIVRCMPNTPAQVLKGASGLYANAFVSDVQKGLSEALFAAIGQVAWLADERLMHSVTALSGSGPAYVFLMIEAMEAAAIAQGIDGKSARKFAAQTVLGAAEMVLQSEVSPAQLKKNVMSPGGTTERAIQVFEQEGFVDMVAKAMQAAADRSEELAAILSGRTSG